MSSNPHPTSGVAVRRAFTMDIVISIASSMTMSMQRQCWTLEDVMGSFRVPRFFFGVIPQMCETAENG